MPKLLCMLSLFVGISAGAQSVAINTDNSTAHGSAALDVKSSSKGLLIPRLSSAERLSITSPAKGLMVFDKTTASFYYYDGAGWKEVGADNLGNHTATQNINLNGKYLSGSTGNNGLQISGDGDVSIVGASVGTALTVTQPSGHGAAAFQAGTSGSAALFNTTGVSNGAASLTASTLGLGPAGSFSISNTGNSNSALEGRTTGTGWGGAFYGGALVRGKGTSSSTQAFRVENTSGTTLLRLFDNGSVALNSFNALNYGGYSSVGTLMNKKGLTIASGTSYTSDAPAVLELVGSAATVGEELGMIDFVHQSSNASVYNVARITAVRENSNPTFTGLAFYTRQFATLSEVMRIANTGNIGIGCTAPQYKLHVVGDIAAQGGIVRASSVSVSTTITACSDGRYKRDIHAMTNLLPMLLQIQSVTYHFKTAEFADRSFPQTEQIGFIAQDVEKVFPQVVVTDKDGYKSIDYTRFAPLLLQGLREQQDMIQSVQRRNAEMAADLEKIKKALGL